jgi:hypothetical protein
MTWKVRDRSRSQMPEPVRTPIARETTSSISSLPPE